MHVEVTFLTRRGRDAVMRRHQAVTADEIRFGRGSDNEVQLPDIRVGLSVAALVHREHDFVLQQSGDTVRHGVDGTMHALLVVRPGDRVLLGPYQVTFTDAPAGFDAALTIELVHPVGDSLQRLAAGNQLGLDKTGLDKRRMSWAFFAVCLVGCLVVPLIVFGIDNGQSWMKSGAPAALLTLVNMTWNVGELSNTHRFFADQCATCHRSSFSRVPDSACLDCHRNVGGHVEPAAAGAAGSTASAAPPAHRLQQTPCGDCHVEHRGRRGLVRQDASLCVSCHGSIAETAPQFGVRDVTGFPAGHPQFRATVVADAGKQLFARAEIGAAPKPVDRPNLKFSHAAHLVEKGFLTPQGQKRMVCADCHILEPGGQGFMPITYKGQCQSCHDLKFDAELPWKEVPHGDDLRVRAAVEDFYAHIALQNGVPPAAPPTEPTRRVPGAPVATPPPAPKPDALAWARAKANDALDLIYNDKRGCAYCHVMDGGADHRVAPVLMRPRFLPNARFNHARHAAVDCAECHDSRRSEASADVLIPGLESCTGCHGSARASFKTQSECVTCHAFHRPEFGPMRRTAAAGP